ncbi:MAG: MATE family efflux transporter [Ruminococcus sp.]|nr:MATE family efflux transporter [Ruminococcus sp.]
MLPITFQQFMSALVSASDALMLGALSQNSMSAVSLAGQVIFVENLFLAAVTIGLSMFASQYWGKHDFASIENVFAYSMKVTLIVSVVFFLGGLCIPDIIISLFTNDPILISLGAVYLRTVSAAFLLTGISQIFLCILKNCGKAAKSGIISSACVVINIILNAVLIFGLFGFPKMGAAGAALATVIARLIEVIWCVLETANNGHVKLCIKKIAARDKEMRSDFWKYTTPVLGNEIVWGIGFTMYSVIMGHLDSDAVAANAVANIVKNLVACFCLGLGSGSGIMVGNELGAGRFSVAKEYGGKLCRLSIMCGAVSGLILLMLIPSVLMVTDLSPQADTYLKGMLVMCSYYLVGKSVNSTTIAGIFCAGGDSKFGFLCDTVTIWCVTVPLGLIAAFVFHLPVPAVYFVINLDEIIKLPAVYLHYKKYQWVKNLTVREN